MNVTVKFLGATGTVTGSRFLLDIGDFRVLFDCGLFQGLKELRLRSAELTVGGKAYRGCGAYLDDR